MIIKICLITIAVLLYLWAGTSLFHYAVRCIGGKEEYIREIHEDHPGSNANQVYFVAGLIVVLFWPYFLIGGLIHK